MQKSERRFSCTKLNSNELSAGVPGDPISVLWIAITSFSGAHHIDHPQGGTVLCCQKATCWTQFRSHKKAPPRVIQLDKITPKKTVYSG